MAPPASATGAPVSPNATPGLPGFLAKGPMSLQVQPGIGSEGAQGPDPAALEAQQAQQEAEMAANEASMKGQQEAQKIQAENNKLKMEAQQAKLEADQVKAQAQMEKEQLQSQKAVAQAEMAKMKAEQELVVEKSKTSQQDQSMKLMQNQAKAREQQKDMQTETAMQQANLQAEQAKMQAQSQADQAGMQAEQAKMQAGMQAETAKAQQQDMASKSNLQQMMAQHDAQKAQSGAELSSRENQLGMKEQVLQEKAQMQPPAPEMHPSAVKLAKYASRMQRETGQFFFKSGTQQPAVTPPVTPPVTPTPPTPSTPPAPRTPRPPVPEYKPSLIDRAVMAKPFDGYEKWLTDGTGNPLEKRFWNDANKYKWYNPMKLYGASLDAAQGVGSYLFRDATKAFIGAGEQAREGNWGQAAKDFGRGTLHGTLSASVGGGGIGLATKPFVGKAVAPAAWKTLSAGGKLGRGLLVGGRQGAEELAMEYTPGDTQVSADRTLMAQREAQADKMMASIEEESKRNSPTNFNNYQHIPEDIRAQYMNRYAVNPSGMHSNFNPNQPQPGLFSFETLANILSSLLTGGLQNRNMLAPRAPAPYDNYLQNSVGEYANRVQAGNPYNPYSG
jgi:chemotaxis protein histidine kinase CheA